MRSAVSRLAVKTYMESGLGFRFTKSMAWSTDATLATQRIGPKVSSSIAFEASEISITEGWNARVLASPVPPMWVVPADSATMLTILANCLAPTMRPMSLAVG
eukprot:Amastigsp_a174666_32.p4 type:complete len:103 gc:universal Amastigsp_a174666_32:1364-1056(-)